jgi:hypothetical protein
MIIPLGLLPGYRQIQITRVLRNNNLLQNKIFNLAVRILSYNSLVTK